MIKNNNKKTRKIFVEETIGTRKYFSYRADLMLYKILLCVFIYFLIYMITSEFLISAFISLQVLLIFTLINKLNLERKEKEGRKFLLTKIKKDYFKNKINEMDLFEFKKLIKHFFEKQGYTNYKEIESEIYSTEKSEETFFIKIFKFYDVSEVEKIDIRNFVSFMNQNKIKNGFCISANEISKDANEFIDKLNKDLKLIVIDIDKLLNMAEECNFLPDDSFFYDKIETEKAKNKSSTIKNIKSNALSNKKIIMYVFAALLFYILSKIMPYNNLLIYLTYYFIILTIVSTVYFIILKIYKYKVSE